MAAGQGFKTFATGEVLTAADVNGYLMQGVGVFADAANRDAEITSPQEGQFAYLSDTNVTTYYTGSAWANLDTTGMTNPMTTTGDVIYSSSGSTPARLGIGTAGQVLQVNSGATAPEWATPGGAGASWTQANVGNEYPGSVSTFTISGISNVDKIMVFVENADSTNVSALVGVVLNTDTTAANYDNAGVRIAPAATYSVGILELPLGNGNIRLCGLSTNAGSTGEGYALITGCNSTNPKVYQAVGGVAPVGDAGAHANIIGGFYLGTSAISSVSVVLDTGTFVFGTRVFVYTSA
jgi:hypothetical protein